MPWRRNILAASACILLLIISYGKSSGQRELIKDQSFRNVKVLFAVIEQGMTLEEVKRRAAGLRIELLEQIAGEAFSIDRWSQDPLSLEGTLVKCDLNIFIEKGRVWCTRYRFLGDLRVVEELWHGACR